MNSAKKFLWKDKTGRGIRNTFTLAEIIKLADSEDKEEWEEGEYKELSYWAETAEEGDEFETQTQKYICIK